MDRLINVILLHRGVLERIDLGLVLWEGRDVGGKNKYKKCIFRGFIQILCRAVSIIVQQTSSKLLTITKKRKITLGFDLTER